MTNPLIRTARPRPPLLLRIYAVLTFPFSPEGSLVWWWRMHVNVHRNDEAGCPYCHGGTE